MVMVDYYDDFHNIAKRQCVAMGDSMPSLQDLLDEYDRLGTETFSTAHDFTLRQRRLERWAAKARAALADVLRSGAVRDEAQDALSGTPPVVEPARRS